MELNARITKNLKNVFITKPTEELGDVMVELKEAKRIYNDGDVAKCNPCFQRLADLDFNIKKLKRFYQVERENARKSSTDDS